MSFIALFHSPLEHILLIVNDYFELLDPSLDEIVNINKKGLYSEKLEYILNQFTKHKYPINLDLLINSIVSVVYHDDSSNSQRTP